MRKWRTITAGVLNVTIHPHSAGKASYVRLFDEVFALERKVRMRGDQFGMLGSLFPADGEDPSKGITGEVVRFTDIRTDEPWLNLNTSTEAKPSELKEVQIPDHLRPHYSAFRYYFSPDLHKLVVQLAEPRKSISANAVAELFKSLFDHPKIKEMFHDVNVHLVQEPDKLVEIFQLPQISKLCIVVSRPNPDEADPADIVAVEKELAEQGAHTQKLELTNARGESIKPNERTKRLAKVAVSHGSVLAHGKDLEGATKHIDTSDHPMTHQFRHSLNGRISFMEAFIEFAKRVLYGSKTE